MRTSLFVATLLLFACSGGGSSSSSRTIPVDLAPQLVNRDPMKQPTATPPSPKRPWPATRKDSISESIHGVTIADPYRWLEDERSNEVQAWMKAQDDHARAALDKLPGRAELTERLKKLLYYDAISAPLHRKGRFFYTRKHADKEKQVVYWKQGEKGAEKVLFDPNTWSADG